MHLANDRFTLNVTLVAGPAVYSTTAPSQLIKLMRRAVKLSFQLHQLTIGRVVMNFAAAAAAAGAAAGRQRHIGATTLNQLKLDAALYSHV